MNWLTSLRWTIPEHMEGLVPTVQLSCSSWVPPWARRRHPLWVTWGSCPWLRRRNSPLTLVVPRSARTVWPPSRCFAIRKSRGPAGKSQRSGVEDGWKDSGCWLQTSAGELLSWTKSSASSTSPVFFLLLFLLLRLVISKSQGVQVCRTLNPCWNALRNVRTKFKTASCDPNSKLLFRTSFSELFQRYLRF